MPNEIALKALSYGLIWFSFLLLLAALLISQRKDYFTDQASRHIFPFTIAMIGLWALIALGIIYTQSDKATSVERGSTLGAHVDKSGNGDAGQLSVEPQSYFWLLEEQRVLPANRRSLA